MKFINKTKEVLHYMNIFWNLKEFSIQYVVYVVGSIFVFPTIGASMPFWWIIPIIASVVPIIILTIHWFKVIKPFIKRAKREAMLEIQYAWMYDRITKHKG